MADMSSSHSPAPPSRNHTKSEEEKENDNVQSAIGHSRQLTANHHLFLFVEN
jgi:hypothetical protein